MSFSGSEDSRCSNWATTRFAIVSSIGLPRKMMRSLSSLEKMSNSRSPLAVRSMTMGTSGMARTLAGADLVAQAPREVGDDPVDAEVERGLHPRARVDRVGEHLQVPVVGAVDELRRQLLQRQAER